MTAAQIRQTFLDFFKDKNHTIVPSAPLVVKGDTTLMFINSGMAPFKDYFLGNTEAKSPRIADTQKCLRVSGKHNDLEDVGHDTYHHTLFEMLGNWSFGDYFKKEAIEWAWELLTKHYGLDKDRLYVSVFAGDTKDGLAKDTEAFNYWTQWIDASRIIDGSKKDNFWEMGDTGPCGPCSEIHVDLRPDAERKLVDGKTLVNKDHPQVIEIWNIVFMQYERMANGSLRELKSKHIDTGMGFERLVRALQHKSSNYDTDIFQPLIQATAKKAGLEYGKEEKVDIALRVVADHIRAISFTIADGQLPSNTGAGYVIRRIIRRAVRYGYTFLNLKEPFLYELCPVLAEQFKTVFPELQHQLDFVKKVIQEEEQSFLRTLATGIQKFDKYLEQKPKRVEGAFAFELFDTYGFPIDLTALLAKEANLDVDMKAFDEELQKQKERSRKATAQSVDDWQILQESNQEFVGYDKYKTESRLIKYRAVQHKGKSLFQLMFDVVPFYPEGGGQVGDKGVIINAKGQQTEIINTIKENNEILLISNTLPEELEGVFTCNIKTEERISSAKNHSATHLLHSALRQVLGKHVEQKGSLVNPEYLRFDFAHFNKMTDEEIAQVEAIVNQKIIEAIPLKEERNVPFQQAIDSGVTALFGEKYGDFVRVITFDDQYSKELCGGTHIDNTLKIRFFKIQSESAVAAGVRRIEALTDVHAIQYYQNLEQTLSEIQVKLKNPQNVLKAIETQQEEIARLQKEIEQLNAEKGKSIKQEIKASLTSIDGLQLGYLQTDFKSQEIIKSIAFELTQEVPNLVLVIVQIIDNAPLFSVGISKALTEQAGLNASNIIRNITALTGGGGGGQAFYSNGKGKSIDKLQEVKNKVLDLSLIK
jgi:alanyl-tRNA synthetase